MISKDQVKKELDKVRNEDLALIYRIVHALAETSPFDGSKDQTNSKHNWEGFVHSMYGCLSNNPIKRGTQGDFEERENIR